MNTNVYLSLLFYVNQIFRKIVHEQTQNQILLESNIENAQEYFRLLLAPHLSSGQPVARNLYFRVVCKNNFLILCKYEETGVGVTRQKISSVILHVRYELGYLSSMLGDQKKYTTREFQLRFSRLIGNLSIYPSAGRESVF